MDGRIKPGLDALRHRTLGAPVTLRGQHHLEGGFRLGGDFVQRHAFGQFNQSEAGAALLVDGEHAKIGDDHIHHMRAVLR